MGEMAAPPHNPFHTPRGRTTPFTTGVHLSFDVSFVTPAGVTLLHEGVAGQVPPGAVLAVMGASGAGKSTLLNVLAGRLAPSTGAVRLNGAAPEMSTFSRLLGYCAQDVPFLSYLTPRETLRYAARLRLPREMSPADKRARVERVLRQLDLLGCADTRVGTAGEAGGISGGERRRLGLAAELLYDPRLLLADEITSGLDAASAKRIALILRRLAREDGRTVVITLHQPRADLMPLFDQLLLLAGGRVVYYGPTWDAGEGGGGAASGGMLDYFAAAGYPFPAFANPADVLLDLVHAEREEGEGLNDTHDDDGEGGRGEDDCSSGSGASDDGGPPKHGGAAAVPAAAAPHGLALAMDAEAGGGGGAPPSRRATVVADLVARYAASPLAAYARADPPAFPPPPQPAFGSQHGRYPSSWATQVRVVAERAFWYKWRNPDAVMSQFVGSAVMAVIVGSVFWQLPLTGGGVRDRLSAISFILLTTSFVAFDQVLILPHERAVMLRDSAAGAYSTAAFFVGRTLAEAPVHSVFAVVTALVTQAMFGLRTDPRATGVYVMVHLLVMHAGAALLTLVGALSKTMAMGNGLATIVIVFASLFNGFFIGPANIPLVYRWIADISFPSFGVRAATATELAGLTYACTPEEAAAGCTGVGDDVLASLGWGAVDAWQACGWLALETAVFRVLAFLALHFMYTGQPLRERARQLWHG